MIKLNNDGNVIIEINGDYEYLESVTNAFFDLLKNADPQNIANGTLYYAASFMQELVPDYYIMRHGITKAEQERNAAEVANKRTSVEIAERNIEREEMELQRLLNANPEIAYQMV